MYKINNFNLRIPVLGAPMFTISNPNLVINQCISGIIGSFPALNAREPETLDEWIKKIKDGISKFETDNPGSIRWILRHPLQAGRCIPARSSREFEVEYQISTSKRQQSTA